MGGGKDKKDQTQLAPLVENLLGQQKGAARQIRQATRVPQATAAGQVTDVLKTGGVGANIPAFNLAQAGEASAQRRAQQQIGEALGRAGIGDVLSQRLQQQLGVEGGARLNALRANLASPILGAGVQAGLTGGQQSLLGLAGAGRTLLAGQQPLPTGQLGTQRLAQGIGGGFQTLAQSPDLINLLRGRTTGTGGPNLAAGIGRVR